MGWFHSFRSAIATKGGLAMHIVHAKGILSPTGGMNLYRGCTHGCIYCDSRSRCYQINHPFEDIEVKGNALELLEAALRRRRKPCIIATGAMTDPYIPLEKELQHMRHALELIERYGFGATVLTKSTLVLRDIDLLARIHRKTKCVVQMTLTTHDESLCRLIEPHVSTTRERVEALLAFRDAGIPTVVWLSPILPYINDTEENIRGVLESCIEAQVRGVVCFGMGMTLREGNREYFFQQLDRHFPGLKARYVREFHNWYAFGSPDSERLMRLFHETCEAHGIMHDNDEIFAWLHDMEKQPDGEQLSLLDSL